MRAAPPAFRRPRTYAPAARPRLWFETLEPRRVLSVTLDNGILTIRGTDNPDDFLIAIYSGTTFEGGPNQFFEFVEVEQRSPEGNLAQAVVGIRGVRGIRLEAGAGNDLVSIEDRTDGHIPITLLGGAGDDTLAGTHADDLLDGQAGNDSVVGDSGGHDTLPDAPWAPDPDRDPELVYDRYDRVAGRIHLDDDGTLRVTGTDADEVIQIAFPENQPARLGVWINTVLTTLDPAAVRRIVVDARAGNDVAHLYSWGRPISVPVTLIGGDGDDLLAGLWYMSGWPHDGQRVSPEQVGPLTAFGGNGNDTLYGGAGDSYLDAGYGQDQMESRGGPTTFIDPPDPTPAPTPESPEMPEVSTPDLTSDQPTPTPSAGAAPAAPTTQSPQRATTNPLLTTEDALLSRQPDAVWS